VGSTMKDEILLVVGRILMSLAKDALHDARPFGSACRDIRMSPGTPESFHEKDLVRPELKAGPPTPFYEGLSLMSSFSSLPALK
jgi:hypothetical protein